MSIHVNCVKSNGFAFDGDPPVEDTTVVWSETLTSAGSTTNVVPTDQGSSYILAVKAYDGAAWIGFGGAPNASSDPRRLLSNGERVLFNAKPGDKVGWAAGPAGAAGGTSSSPTVTQPAPLAAGTDRSGSITTGGTAQQLAAANASRSSLKGQNISAGDLWINEIGGTAAIDATGSYKVASGQTFSIGTNRAVSVIGATTGQKWTATEVG